MKQLWKIYNLYIPGLNVANFCKALENAVCMFMRLASLNGNLNFLTLCEEQEERSAWSTFHSKYLYQCTVLSRIVAPGAKTYF